MALSITAGECCLMTASEALVTVDRAAVEWSADGDQECEDGDIEAPI